MTGPGHPVRTEPGYRREGDVMTERDWGLLEVFSEKFDFWMQRHAGIELGAPAGTRRESSPSCWPPGVKREYAYAEALISPQRLREAVGELMRVMEKIGREVPG